MKPAPMRRLIGVFDSGVGGLTVLRSLMSLLPDENFVYLGDTARVPYGNKSRKTVELYAKQCARFLLTQEAQMIVVACNTVSALALEQVRRAAGVPVVGMVLPAARSAVQTSRSGRIGVIGTRATIASGAYEQALRECQNGTRLHIASAACPLFVPMVEEGFLDHAITEQLAQEYLKPILAGRVDTLILGCTHYPMLSPLLERQMPGVKLVDSGYAASADAKTIAQSLKPTARAPKSQVSIHVTDRSLTFTNLAKLILGHDIGSPRIASIDHL